MAGRSATFAVSSATEDNVQEQEITTGVIFLQLHHLTPQQHVIAG